MSRRDGASGLRPRVARTRAAQYRGSFLKADIVSLTTVLAISVSGPFQTSSRVPARSVCPSTADVRRLDRQCRFRATIGLMHRLRGQENPALRSAAKIPEDERRCRALQWSVATRVLRRLRTPSKRRGHQPILALQPVLPKLQAKVTSPSQRSWTRKCPSNEPLNLVYCNTDIGLVLELPNGRAEVPFISAAAPCRRQAPSCETIFLSRSTTNLR
jgi:hypothetical protein